MATRMTEAFKGVVWNRGKVEIDGETVHKYAVVGVLITDKPVPELEAGTSYLVGRSQGLAVALADIDQGYAEIRLGDANSVLTGLGHVRPTEHQPEPGETWRAMLERKVRERGWPPGEDDIQAVLAAFDQDAARGSETEMAIVHRLLA